MASELLLLRSGRRLCALSVSCVDEIMRPMPVESLPGAPPFVRGLSIVRGRPTPIVDLRAILGDDDRSSPGRLVTVRVETNRRVGLLVDDVMGIRDAKALVREAPPSLLQEAASEIVEELARLDDALLTILRAGNLYPEGVDEQISRGEDAQ